MITSWFQHHLKWIERTIEYTSWSWVRRQFFGKSSIVIYFLDWYSLIIHQSLPQPSKLGNIWHLMKLPGLPHIFAQPSHSSFFADVNIGASWQKHGRPGESTEGFWWFVILVYMSIYSALSTSNGAQQFLQLLMPNAPSTFFSFHTILLLLASLM